MPDNSGSRVRPGQTRRAHSPQILLVDDQPFFLATIQGILRAGGYQVQTAVSGLEAMQTARVSRPDAILLDVVMPGVDGFEVCRRLKADSVTAAIPVILFTASRDLHLNRKAFEVGAEATILKSVDAGRLLNIIQVVLGTLKPRPGAPRTSVVLAVTYAHADQPAAGETLNLSSGGMFIKTPSPPGVGSLLRLRFALPGQQYWECPARVVWTRRPGGVPTAAAGMGVQFFDLPSEVGPAIAAFVAARATSGSPSGR